MRSGVPRKADARLIHGRRAIKARRRWVSRIGTQSRTASRLLSGRYRVCHARSQPKAGRRGWKPGFDVLLSRHPGYRPTWFRVPGSSGGTCAPSGTLPCGEAAAQPLYCLEAARVGWISHPRYRRMRADHTERRHISEVDRREGFCPPFFVVPGRAGRAVAYNGNAGFSFRIIPRCRSFRRAQALSRVVYGLGSRSSRSVASATVTISETLPSPSQVPA